MRLTVSTSLLLLSTVLLPFVTSKPHYIDCQSSEDCGSVACCVIGSARFSLPRCEPLLQMGETCSYSSFYPLNTTVYYPDGADVRLTNVYNTICPCEPGLTCGSSGVCFDPTLADNLNSIDNDIYH